MTYNLKNSLVWLVLFPYFSPTRTPNLFMLAGRKAYAHVYSHLSEL